MYGFCNRKYEGKVVCDISAIRILIIVIFVID